MPELSRFLLGGLAVSALLFAAATTACREDTPPSEQAAGAMPLEDSVARLERTSDRLSEAADRIQESGGEREGSSTLIHVDVLRLLALLSQLQVELDIVHHLIDPKENGRPRHWPLNSDDGLALGYVSLRLSWIKIELSEYVEALVQESTIFSDESIISALAELMTELDHIHSSVWSLRHSHDEGAPMAPGTRPVRSAQTMIERLIDALGTATSPASAAVDGRLWNSLQALERMQWAAKTSCSALGCFGDHDYAVPDPLTLGLLRYSSLEFEAGLQRALAFPRQKLRGPRCRLEVAHAETALWSVLTAWREMFEYAGDAPSRAEPPPRMPPSDATKSLIHLFRGALMRCSIEVAPLT